MHVAHLTFSSAGRLPPFPDERSLRAAIRALARVAGRSVVLFSFVDDHSHIVVAAGALSECTKLGQALLFTLRPIAQVPLDPPHITPVETRGHLETLVAYHLNQTARHGLDAHPALWTGSCFPDLVGARLLATPPMPLKELLPRFRVSRAFEVVDLDSDLPIIDDTRVKELGAKRIVEAAAFVHAAQPDLPDKSRATMAARRAAVHMARHVGAPDADLARALAIPRRSLRRLAASPVEPASLRALRARLSLELAVLRAPVETPRAA